jgi:hypothetical protein
MKIVMNKIIYCEIQTEVNQFHIQFGSLVTDYLPSSLIFLEKLNTNYY